LLDALDRYRKADKLFDRLYEQLEKANAAAIEEHGWRPDQLIHWRNYHIGGSEIERVRKEFLEREIDDVSVIEREYRDAKKRYRATVRAGKDWDKRVGVELKVKALHEARAELRAANKVFATVKLQSVADASALFDFIYANIRDFEPERWEMAALRNAITFLSRWTAMGRAANADRRSADPYSAGTLVPDELSPIRQSVDDPTFAAIEAHRQACVKQSRCVDLELSLHDDDPAKPNAEIATGNAWDETYGLANELLKIRPSTRAGAAALLDHVSAAEEPNHGGRLLAVTAGWEDWRFPQYAENGKPFHLATIKHVADALGSIEAPGMA
jgi:hypothetical protein